MERWKKKHLQQSVEKWRTQVLMIPSKSGEMVIKRDPSSTSTSVLRQPDDSWIPNSSDPVNIGSEEMVTINELVDIAAKVANKKIKKNHIDGPLGVRGRNSNNDLIREKLGWDYEQTLEEGIKKTYGWISYQISKEMYGVPPYDDPDFNPYESAEVMAAG